jgi:Fic family protein
VPDSEFEIKKSLTVTRDLPNDDDVQEVEEIATLEVSPTLDGERSSSKKTFAAKTSTTGESKKSRAIVDSVVAARSATVEDILMGEADSEPFNSLKAV